MNLNKDALLRFINEHYSYIYDVFLSEEKKPKVPAKLVDKDGNPTSDTNGVLHEILVGKHLRGGHMEKHKDTEGHSPKEAHDKMKAGIRPEDYKKADAKAKSAAEDIRKHVEKNGHKIHDVHWTSKAGDLHKSTGIHASQKEDASDIVVHTHKGKHTKFHGVSLKVSGKTNVDRDSVPVSNPGLESTRGGAAHVHAHHAAIKKDYPKLVGKSTAEKKEMMKSDPKMDKDVRDRATKTVHKVVDHLHKQLSKMPSKELSHHVRHLIHAEKTPMQKQGHNHFRHTTYEDKNGKPVHKTIDPSTHHDKMLNDHKNIKIEKTKAQLYFSHNGKRFASHRIKLENGGNPFSSVKGMGSTHGE